MKHNRFEGKVVLVTGATSGIGEASALAFAKEGAMLVLAGRREEEGLRVQKSIEDIGAKAIFVKTDITKEEDVIALIVAAVAAFGKIDIAFNNAGTDGAIKPITEKTLEDYNHTFNTNVLGTFFSMKHEVAQMQKNGGGSIVNTASIAGLVGLANGSFYAASEHAIIGLTKSVALEVAKQNIRVNAVAAGVAKTAMMERFTGGIKEVQDFLATLHPIGRFAEPEEIAKAVLFLASDDASFMTGESMAVDGGYTAQ